LPFDPDYPFGTIPIAIEVKRAEECAIVAAAAAGSIFEREAHFPYEAEKNRVPKAVGELFRAAP
jgi:hypothetical protein